MGAPNFWKSFGDALSLSAQDRGIMAYCPWFLLVTLAIGIVIGFFALSIGADFVRADTVAALAAMMVAAGFLGAVSIGCMSQIFTTLNDAEFSEYLQEINAFDQFLAWPQIVYFIQMAYFVLCALSILLVCIADGNSVRAFALSVMAVATFYVTNKTWQLIDLLRILAWHRQDFARLLRQAKQDAGV